MAQISVGQSRQLKADPGANLHSGDWVSLTAHDACALGSVGRLNASSEVILADADAAATAGAVVIALGTITAHTAGRFALPGSVLHLHTLAPGWTPGELVYLSTTAGEMTQTAPSGAADMIQVLGTAWAADILHFAPCLMMVEHG
jgi:hypothetical protein